jgi:replication factor C large subunit
MQTTLLGENQNAPKVALHEPWVEKYRPRSVQELVGNQDKFKQLKEWVENWIKGGLILAGPSGVGKTCGVYAVAKEMGLEVLEMNASDLRTKASISERIGSASMQRSLVAKGKIILVDEIDGVYGTVDRGGVPEIIRILEKSRFPVVFTANDLDKNNLKDLKKVCKRVVLDPATIADSSELLKNILEKEKISAEEGVLEEIARRSGGDLRTAVLNLESVSGNNKISKEDLESIGIKEQLPDIEKVLGLIFRTKNNNLVKQAVWDLNMDPGELRLWVGENIAREYDDPNQIAAAFDAVSRSDVFSGRIIHNQSWGLLKYVSSLMSIGVCAVGESKKERQFLFPQIIAKMGRTKFTRAKRDEKAAMYGELLHCSKKRVQEQMGYFELF